MERLVNRCEAVIRLFSKYGNRKNKNKARLKFVVRERGFDWVKEQIEKEYQDILTNGGIPTPEVVPEGFGGFQSAPPPLGNGDLLPSCANQWTRRHRIRSLAQYQHSAAEAARLRDGHRKSSAR